MNYTVIKTSPKSTQWIQPEIEANHILADYADSRLHPLHIIYAEDRDQFECLKGHLIIYCRWSGKNPPYPAQDLIDFGEYIESQGITTRDYIEYARATALGPNLVEISVGYAYDHKF